MQQAGQVPYLDQNDAHEQSLGQSDVSLPGPEQTLNQSIIGPAKQLIQNGSALQHLHCCAAWTMLLGKSCAKHGQTFAKLKKNCIRPPVF